MDHKKCYRFAYKVISFPLYEKSEKKVIVVAYPFTLIEIFSVPPSPKNGCTELLALDCICAEDLVGWNPVIEGLLE
jgi:hypothetical protein